MKLKDQDLIARAYTRVLREQAGFSIGNELYKLYTEVDPNAKTKTGAKVSDELKLIMKELEDIVQTASRNRAGDEPEKVLTFLIQQLSID